MRTQLLTLACTLGATFALAACGNNAGTGGDDCETACDAPPAARCEGDVFIAYAPVGECVDGECRYETVSQSCAGGCGADGCAEVPCDDADCTSPPVAACDGNTALSYDAAGTCNDEGVCTYSETRTDCEVTEQICREGACVDPADPCAEIACDVPPAPSCDGDTAVTYASAGTCADGVCSYSESRTDCAANEQVCQDGACVDPVVDPCDGVVCDAPPAATCEGETAVTYAATGACTDGECGYDATRADCAAAGQICQEGACVDPVDLCADVVCDDLPDDTCDEAGNRLVYSTGDCVDADGSCDYVPAVVPCEADTLCVDGACIPAVDPCEEVVCNTPPGVGCASETERSSYSSTGICQVVDSAATCIYDVVIETCDASVPACFEGTCRAVPQPGQLEITEILYDPAGADEGAEWVEIRNTTAAPLFLRGVIAATTGNSVELDALTLAGGAFLVLESSTAATPAAGVVWADLALDNNAGFVELRRGDTVVDRVSWDEGGGWPAAVGRSLSLDPAAADNGVPAAWCFGTAIYSGTSSSLGSPGTANAACDFACFDVECPIPASFCDGDVRVVYSDVGTCDADDSSCDYSAVEVRQDCAAGGQICDAGFCRPRPPSIPAGSVIVSEFLANTLDGPTGDWIELRNTTASDLALDGLVVTNESDRSFVIVDVTIPASGYVVLAAADDTLADGADYVWGATDFEIGDNQDSIVLTFDGNVVDRVDYNVSTWPIEPETAAAFNGAGSDNNNDPAFWCASRVEIGDGTLGTPGAANDDCFADELPDPPALSFGALVIAEVMVDPTGIADEAGEWFEIYNASGSSIDMRAIEIRSDAGSFVIGRDGFFVNDRAPILAPNGLFVVGRSVGALGEDDEATSRVTYAQTSVLLDNAGDTLEIWAGATMVDSVTYSPEGSAGFPWPFGPGVAMAADTFSLSAAANNEPWAWCEAPSEAFYATFSVGDTDFPQRGTPGTINPFCGF